MYSSSSLFHAPSSLPKQDSRITFTQEKHSLKIKDIGFRCTSYFFLSVTISCCEANTSNLLPLCAQLFPPRFGLLACFCSSYPLTIMLRASTDVRGNSYAMRRKDERKKTEDERKGNRLVTLLTSITCQFTAVAP